MQWKAISKAYHSPSTKQFNKQGTKHYSLSVSTLMRQLSNMISYNTLRILRPLKNRINSLIVQARSNNSIFQNIVHQNAAMKKTSLSVESKISLTSFIIFRNATIITKNRTNVVVIIIVSFKQENMLSIYMII